jgi:hypothetical protein
MVKNKNVVGFSDIFHRKDSEKLKTFSLFCDFEVKISQKSVRATLSSARGTETSGGIRSINMGTNYRSGNTTHLAGESKEKKG